VADINCGCHQCHRCLQGDPRHCAHRSVIGIRGRDGALAEYLKVPLENIHAVPQQIEDHQAVFTEPLAAALEITQQIHITNTDRVAVIGDGKLGLLIALALKHYCPGLVLLGKHTDNLQIVANQDVATRQVPSEGTLSFLNTIDKDFDIVIDATGKPNGLNMGIELVRPEGTIVLKTTSHLPSQIHFAPVVVKEITLIGSRCGDLSLALSFLKNKWIDVSPLIDSIYPFHDLSKAFSRAQQPGIKKVLISMQ
jgi:threonine dehydrogenase-like Zn-dependent dehydrogenase